jgi:hypothetical protein
MPLHIADLDQTRTELREMSGVEKVAERQVCWNIQVNAPLDNGHGLPSFLPDDLLGIPSRAAGSRWQATPKTQQTVRL